MLDRDITSTMRPHRKQFVIGAARNHSLLLSLQQIQRLGSLVQMELIRQLAPELLKYPCNPSDEYFDIIRSKLRIQNNLKQKEN